MHTKRRQWSFPPALPQSKQVFSTRDCRGKSQGLVKRIYFLPAVLTDSFRAWHRINYAVGFVLFFSFWLHAQSDTICWLLTKCFGNVPGIAVIPDTGITVALKTERAKPYWQPAQEASSASEGVTNLSLSWEKNVHTVFSVSTASPVLPQVVSCPFLEMLKGRFIPFNPKPVERLVWLYLQA